VRRQGAAGTPVANERRVAVTLGRFFAGVTSLAWGAGWSLPCSAGAEGAGVVQRVAVREPRAGILAKGRADEGEQNPSQPKSWTGAVPGRSAWFHQGNQRPRCARRAAGKDGLGGTDTEDRRHRGDPTRSPHGAASGGTSLDTSADENWWQARSALRDELPLLTEP
jgi:hypothetical protein